MQTMHYDLGPWRADAQVEEVEPGKLMAVISITGAGQESMSRHTVVFDRDRDTDDASQTELLVRRLLQDRYRI